ncbi:hypothetical protein ACH5RR_008013 [Cinchona calisaya]|uniref:Uncharacterized protein n=1 Tax=Cinchona calisaya TaxID=153742 RepID=A0ABD3AA57_9GENT
MVEIGTFLVATAKILLHGGCFVGYNGYQGVSMYFGACGTILRGVLTSIDSPYCHLQGVCAFVFRVHRPGLSAVQFVPSKVGNQGISNLKIQASKQELQIQQTNLARLYTNIDFNSILQATFVLSIWLRHNNMQDMPSYLHLPAFI